MRALTSTVDDKKGRRTMGTWLSEREQRLVAGAEAASAATPIPTQIVSNGEYLPPPQSATQKKVEARINELADLNGKHLGLSRALQPQECLRINFREIFRASRFSTF